MKTRQVAWKTTSPARRMVITPLPVSAEKMGVAASSLESMKAMMHKPVKPTVATMIVQSSCRRMQVSEVAMRARSSGADCVEAQP